MASGLRGVSMSGFCVAFLATYMTGTGPRPVCWPFLRIFMREVTKVTEIEIEVWTCLNLIVTHYYCVVQTLPQLKEGNGVDFGKVAASVHIAIQRKA